VKFMRFVKLNLQTKFEMKKLLYILILGIVLCTFASSDKVLEQGLSIRNIIWAVLALVLFYVISSSKTVFIKSPIFLVFFAFLLVTAISLFKAINVTEGYFEVGRVLVMLVFLYGISVILYEQENKDKLIIALIILALCIGIYGVYEYFTVTYSRRLGFMSNRNLWSAAHLLLLPFCLYGLKRWRYLCIVAGTLLLFNIVTLMTRSVWASLLVSTFVTLLIFRKIPKIRVIVLILVVVGLFLYFGNYKRRIRGVIGTDSLALRFQTWKQTLQMSRDNLLGVGAGNWKINVAKYGNEYPGVASDGTKAQGERFFLRPHNDGLWVLSETGVIGFGLYATIFLMSLYYSYKTKNMAMFFGIMCYLGFAFFSFPKERVFPSVILLVMIAIVIPKEKWICLSPQLVHFAKVLVTVLLLMTISLYAVKFKTEIMIRRVIDNRGRKNWQEVINIIDNEYSRLSTIDPIFATPIIFYRAEAYLYLGNYRQALEDFKRAYRQNPFHIYVISNLASCYAIQGFPKEAIEYYEETLRICPSFVAARNNLKTLKGRS